MERDDMRDSAGLDWRIRNFEREDIPALAALFSAADCADRLYKLASEESLRESFSDVTAGSPTQVIVAEGPSPPNEAESVLLGMGRVFPMFHSAARERVYNVMLRTHPIARPQGLQHEIARRLIEISRATEAASTTAPADKVRVLAYLFDSQTSSIEAWEKAGLRRERTGWTVARALDEPLEVTPAPDGIVLRTYEYPQDNSQAIQAYNSAMSDYYDHHTISEASWAREMGASYSRPDLSWLALSAGDSSKVVGVAGSQVNMSENKESGRLEGWVEGIGVVPSFRQRGIGKALLSRCMQSFQNAGLEIALADVDSESVAAVTLFHSVGFKMRSALLQYECLLEETQF